MSPFLRSINKGSAVRSRATALGWAEGEWESGLERSGANVEILTC